ncbi:hypothetical protein ACJIZ3_013500 [Penstemon smallii]|uniref:YTH domain-containing family protein n=1 Tax=Penstemon smallii TaxID=265156 RepID=A0ABD3RGQ5_9LAMI
MEVYNIPDQGLADMYLVQGTESNPQFTGQLDQFEAMYNDGTPEFFVDQGLYYPTASSYGYICTGFEPTGDWEDHHRIFGLDGQDIQYTGAANETLPYVYYTPGYGYTQSPYNPYNPYIPGAMMGVDGSFITPQQYYALPSYENPVTSSAYVPMVLQPRPDSIANGIADSFVENGSSVNQINGHVAKHNIPSNFPNSSQPAVGNASSRRNSFARVSEGTGSGKQTLPSSNSGSFPSQASSQVVLARGPQCTEYGSSDKLSSGSTPLETAFPPGNGFSGFESSDHARSSAHKVRPKLLLGRVLDDVKVSPDALGEQNRGPRMNKPKNQLVVKARTTRAGNPDGQGNIIISMDQYNAVDFPVDYRNAKFFVIKSYSEDDVHKSIKYNVWSSTPNGNKKLNAAYEDAHRIGAVDSRGCPIFLFFSVNASGQFCGVAEMTGPVDFDKDMDFWQQDKWSGSFPVKWHFVKDLPNPNFRHIILENNEHKPVTNSRDTQEISYRKGLEMLQIFKNYTSKTSLLDDFMYYENRQRIMQEERARLLIKSYENPYLVPLIDPPRKLQSLHDFPSIGDVNATEHDTNWTIQNKNNEANSSVKPDMVDELKIGSLTIHPKKPETESSLPTSAANSGLVNVVTIGSMPVKVNSTDPSTFVTVGTIPLKLGGD